MRRSLLALLPVLALAASAGAAARPQEEAPPAAGKVVTATTFLVSGRGYGHGVGMCQWGAKGMAEQGYSARQILEYFYPGTTLGSLDAGGSR